MANLVNLNRFRKERARADKAERAAENRVRFGRTKAERNKVKGEADIEAQRLDGHRRDRDPSASKP